MEALWKIGGALERGSHPEDDQIKEWLSHVKQKHIMHAKATSITFNVYLEDHHP